MIYYLQSVKVRNSTDVTGCRQPRGKQYFIQRLYEEPMYYFCKQSYNLICIFVNSLSNVGGLPREVLRIQDFSQHFTAVFFKSSVRS